MAEIKTSVSGLDSVMERTEERVSELEQRTIEITESEQR